MTNLIYLTLVVALAMVIVYLRRSMTRATASQLPSSLSLKDATYDAVDSISNVQYGATNEHEYVVFEHHALHGDFTYTQTVAAIRTDVQCPATSRSLSSGLRFERVGDWLIALEPHRSVGATHHAEFVRDCFRLLEYATDRQAL